MEMTRRNFAQAAAAATVVAATAGVAAANADEAAPAAEAALDVDVEALAEDLANRGGSIMSLEELNARRQKFIDETGPWTRADGTVVPECYTKLRALVKTYSFGIGDSTTDDCFDFFIANFSEEEAEAYLKMPMGAYFTAAEYAQACEGDEAQCVALCEDLAARGLLYRVVRAGVPMYTQLGLMHGMAEYNLDRYDEGMDFWAPFFSARTDGFFEGMMDSGTPFYRSVPVGTEVVGEGKILPLDDWRAIIDRNEVLAVSPCQCRRPAIILGGLETPPDTGDPELVDFDSPICGHPLETCISTGEEAQYYLDKGIARPITKDEAVTIIERSIDRGMVVQSMYTRDSEIICQCHSDCCAVLSTYLALGPEFCETASCMPQVSDYVLNYDPTNCIQCGACAQRCPMTAITMDGEDGRPQVNAMCVRCGQCATVCPASARCLTVKPVEERGYVPKDLIEGYNVLAAYRFDHGKQIPQPAQA